MDKPSWVLPRPRTYNFEALPSELVIYITDFLTSSSIACLSLTCHHLYNLIRERCRVDLDTRPEQFEFLNCIARDLPEYIPCHGWLKPKLYRWRYQCNSYYHCDHCFGSAHHRCKYRRRGSNCPPEVSGLPMLALCAGNLHLGPKVGGWATFGLRQLILRYELLGPEHGVPLSTLNHSCYPPVAGLQKASSVRTVPKIVRNGNLMIHKTVVFQSKSFFDHEWKENGPVCSHTASETLGLAEWACNYFAVKLFLRKESDHLEETPQLLSLVEKTQETEALHEMCKYPDKNWHRCSVLLKCEYCATDTRFYIRKVRYSETQDSDYELRFEVYHDLGSLYQRMTVPQRQLIEVATRLPKIQVKYPSMVELYERICQDLEEQYHAPAPLNIRGTAIHAMEEAVRRDPETILQSTLPTDVCFFSHWGSIDAELNARLSYRFTSILCMCDEPTSFSCPGDEWSTTQLRRPFLPFERDQSPQ